MTAQAIPRIPRLASRVALLVGVLATVGCLSSRTLNKGLSAAEAGRAALGELTVSSPEAGSRTATPTTCHAGDRQLFLGADFEDPSTGMTIRLVVDPLDGPAVRAFSTGAPFDSSLVFRRSECRSFHFSIDSTGWRINDVFDYRVTLEVDCERGDTSLRGSVAATHCH
jgi:hypothetical protein